MERGLKKNVILVPGKAFYVNPNGTSNYLRAAFSLATPEKMDLVRILLAKLLKTHTINKIDLFHFVLIWCLYCFSLTEVNKLKKKFCYQNLFNVFEFILFECF